MLISRLILKKTFFVKPMNSLQQIKIDFNDEKQNQIKIDIKDTLDRLYQSKDLKERTVHYRNLVNSLYCLGLMHVRTEGWLTTLKWGCDTDDWTIKNRMNAYNSLKDYLTKKGVLI